MQTQHTRQHLKHTRPHKTRHQHATCDEQYLSTNIKFTRQQHANTAHPTTPYNLSTQQTTHIQTLTRHTRLPTPRKHYTTINRQTLHIVDKISTDINLIIINRNNSHKKQQTHTPHSLKYVNKHTFNHNKQACFS